MLTSAAALANDALTIIAACYSPRVALRLNSVGDQDTGSEGGGRRITNYTLAVVPLGYLHIYPPLLHGVLPTLPSGARNCDYPRS